MKKINQFFVSMALAFVMLFACFTVTPLKKYETASADTSDTVYYFTDMNYSLIPEDMLSSTFTNYTIRHFTSFDLNTLINTRNPDVLFTSNNYMHKTDSEEFGEVVTKNELDEYVYTDSSGDYNCSVIFECIISLPEAGYLQDMISALKNKGCNIAMISGYPLTSYSNNTFQSNLEYFLYISLEGLVDEFIDYVLDCILADSADFGNQSFIIQREFITNSSSFLTQAEAFNSAFMQKFMERIALYYVEANPDEEEKTDIELLNLLDIKMFVAVEPLLEGEDFNNSLMLELSSNTTDTIGNIYQSYELGSADLYALIKSPWQLEFENWLNGICNNQNENTDPVFMIYALLLESVRYSEDGLPVFGVNPSTLLLASNSDLIAALEDLLTALVET